MNATQPMPDTETTRIVRALIAAEELAEKVLALSRNPSPASRDAELVLHLISEARNEN